jgi:hypothetical protein
MLWVDYTRIVDAFVESEKTKWKRLGFVAFSFGGGQDGYRKFLKSLDSDDNSGMNLKELLNNEDYRNYLLKQIKDGSSQITN